MLEGTGPPDDQAGNQTRFRGSNMPAEPEPVSEEFAKATKAESEIHHPKDIKYMQYLRSGLRLIGIWPGKLLGEKDKGRLPYQCYNLTVVFIGLVLNHIYVKNRITVLSFLDIGQSYITVLMSWVTVLRFLTVLLKRNDKVIQDFINEIHLFYVKDKSPFAMKIHLQIQKYSHIFTIYSIILVVWTAVFYNLTPLYNNISRGGYNRPPTPNITYEQAVYFELPFDYEHNFKGYFIIALFNWYVSFIYAMIFSLHDLVLALMMFHLWGHLTILIYNLENFPRPALEGASTNLDTDYAETVPYKDKGINGSTTHFSKEELIDVGARLKDIINHHKFILKSIKNVSNSYGLTVFIFYAFEQVTLCLLLLECAQMELRAIIRFGPLTIGLLQLLIQTSVIFELLSSKTEPLMRAVYNVPWECMDTKNRRLVWLMLMQAQIPLGLKALGLVEVGCQTMVAIIKTSLSYFMMLRTVA